MFKKISVIGMLWVVTACAKPVSYVPQVSPEKLRAEQQYQQALIAKEKVQSRQQKVQQHIGMQQRLLHVATPIAEAGGKLCLQLGHVAKHGCFFTFELAEEGGINAYADGKKIVVMPGMMTFAQTDEELAVVLGHEYAHNVMGHIASTQTNALFGKLAGALIDGLASSQGIETGGGFGKIGAVAGAQHYSKDFEKEADYIGLYITALAGYDIHQAPQMWRKMSLKNHKAVYVATTHPTNPERYVLLEQVVREIEQKKRNAGSLIPNIRTGH